MANCQELCTAAKCQELENRIIALEQQLSNLDLTILEDRIIDLEVGLDEHINKPTGEAHEWDIYFDSIQFIHDTSPEWQDLLLAFQVLNGQDEYLTEFYQWSDRIPYVPELDFFDHIGGNLADVHDYAVNLTVDPQGVDGSNRVVVDVDGIQAEAFINTEPLSLVIAESIVETGKQFDLTISEGNRTAEASLLIEIATNDEDVTNIVNNYFNSLDFFFRIDDLPDNDYDFVITIGERTRSQILDLPVSSGGGGSGGGTTGEETEQPPATLSLNGSYDVANNDINLTVAVNGKSASTTINLDDMPFDEIKELVEKAVAILGGDTWSYDKDNKTASYKLQPETLIKTTGQAQYSANTDTGKELTISNLIELNTALHSVNYFRSGHHRLPATAFNYLLNTNEGNKELKIYDSLSFQEWIIKNIDALVGEFPLKLKYKNDDGEQEVSLENVSEALAEVTGLLISLAEDSSNNLNATIKAMVEARNAANAATVAVDYASANADYLGYKGREKSREVNVTFTPGKETMKEVLTPSKQKIIGWEMQGEETLLELVKRILLGAEIIKAAMYIPWQPGDKLTGDVIREKQTEQTETEDAKWQEFLNRVNTPTGKYKINKPNAQIKDLTVDEE